MLNPDNVARVIDGHRRWMAEAIQACGHHESHFNSNTGKCVSCPDHGASDFAKTGKNWTVSTTVELDSNSVPNTDKPTTPTDDELITAVYMPNGSLGYYGFNGGGPATVAQKNKVRALLAEHAGNPTVEAIRRTLNARVVEGSRIERCDVSPVLSWFRATFK